MPSLRILLFVAFLVVPLVELAVIVQVGQQIGAGWTILLLLAVSVAGATLVRREGRESWRRFRAALSAGRLPTQEVLDGALVLCGGALMLTPGFVTDALGLFLMLPAGRALASRALLARVGLAAVLMGSTGRPVGRPRAPHRVNHPPRRRGAQPSDDVVEVEVVDIQRTPPEER